MKKKIHQAIKQPILLSSAIYLAISSITFAAFAQDADPTADSDNSNNNKQSIYKPSPFSPVPAYMESQVVTASGSVTSETTVDTTEVGEKKTETVTEKRIIRNGSVKPRIMLLFDDSGSMMESVLIPGIQPFIRENQRIEKLKTAMKNLLTSDEFSDKAKWNMITLWNNMPGLHTGAPADKPVSQTFISGKDLYTRYIANLYPSGMTPTTQVYLRAADAVYNNIEYSCQKNYIIVLSDGDANYDSFSRWSAGDRDYDNNNTFDSSDIAWKSPLRNFYELRASGGLHDNGHLPSTYLYFAPTYVSGNIPGAYNKHDWWYYRTGVAKDKCFSDALLGRSNPERMGLSQCKSIEQSNLGVRPPSLPADAVLNGIEYFSDKLFNKDLVPDSKTDKEGNNYTGKQNINTISIAYGSNMSENGISYLMQAARVPDGFKGKSYIDVRNAQDLENSFRELFTAILDETSLGTDTEETIEQLPYTTDSDVSETKTESSSSKHSTDKYETTALASPVSVATSSLDVSKYPSDVGNNYGLMSILNVNTSNWSSALKFYRIYRTTVKQGDFCDKMNDGGYLCNEANYDKDETPANLASFPHNRQVLSKSDAGYKILDLKNTPSYEEFGFKQEQEFKQGFWPWLLRDASQSDKQIAENIEKLNLDEQVVSQYRDRLAGGEPEYERQMGDVLDAGAIAIANADGREIEEDKTDNAKYLLMGANDGMLYAFERNTAAVSPYQLKFNYLPYRMPREKDETLGNALSQIADVSYGSAIDHMYGVNGGFALLTTASALNDKGEAVRNRETLIIGNMGQGGRGAYALLANGNNPTSPNENAPVGFENSITEGGLWEVYNGKDESKIGYTISKPSAYPIGKNWKFDDKTKRKVVEPLGDIRVAAFIANGFPTGAKDAAASERHNHDAKPSLYIYDALGVNFSLKQAQAFKSDTAGKLLKKIEAPADEHANGINTLAAPVVVDIDFDGIADVAYAGDYNGDLYRFDLRGKTSDWKAVKIFNGEATQPITAAPAVYRIPQKLLEAEKIAGDKFVVVFGTGSDIYHEDRESAGERQAMYGIYDDLTVEKPEAAESSQLIEQTLEVDGNSRYIRKRADGLDEYHNLVGKYKGWKVLLDEGQENDDGTGVTSERVVVQPDVLFEGVFFTTRAYSIEQAPSTAMSFLSPPIPNQTSLAENSDYIQIGEDEVGDWEVVSSTGDVVANATAAGETCGTAERIEQRKIVRVFERKSQNSNTTESVTATGMKTFDNQHTKGYSWFMGINVLTGGKLNSDSITFAKDRYSDEELNAMTEADREKAITKQGEFVGDKYDEILSATVIQRASESNKLRDALNQNGGVQGGELTNPGVVGQSVLTGKPQNNQCARGNNVQDFGIYASGSETGMVQKGLVVKPCGGSFIRTSLREVKMLER